MKSSGTPSESYSRNASSPGTMPLPAAARSSASSRRGSPAVSTASNRSSSLRTTRTMASRPRTSSGYASPISATRTSTSACRNGSVKPSFLPWRIARRMILRST